jgi:hypothetical protein
MPLHVLLVRKRVPHQIHQVWVIPVPEILLARRRQRFSVALDRGCIRSRIRTVIGFLRPRGERKHKKSSYDYAIPHFDLLPVELDIYCARTG